MTERFLVFFVFALIAWAVIFGGAHIVSHVIGSIASIRKKEADEIANRMNAVSKDLDSNRYCAVAVKNGFSKMNYPENEKEVIAIGKSGTIYTAFHESGNYLVTLSEYDWPEEYWEFYNFYDHELPFIKSGWYEKIHCMEAIGCAKIDEEIVAYIELPEGTEK